MTEVLLITTLLVLKHFIVDFPLQTPYQWMNKGTYMHPGGLLHAGLHGLATCMIMSYFALVPEAIWFGLFDAIIHYHVDWAKMNLNAKMGWKPDTHPEFWWLLGLDQLLHYMTYILIVWIAL